MFADLRSAPDDAAQRVIDIVAIFPRRALVSLSEDGVELVPFDDLSALVRENQTSVDALNEITGRATTIGQSAESSRHATSQRLYNLSARILVAMITEVDDANALSVGRTMLQQFRRELPVQQHEAMLQSFITSPIWQLREQFRELGWDQARIASEVGKRDVQLPAGSHLGRHLGVLVNQRRLGQADRGVQDGDVPDRHHVEFAPYVRSFASRV